MAVEYLSDSVHNPNPDFSVLYITMPTSSCGSINEESDLEPLLTHTTPDSCVEPVEDSNNQHRAQEVQISYPLLKFSIAWLGM